MISIKGRLSGFKLTTKSTYFSVKYSKMPGRNIRTKDQGRDRVGWWGLSHTSTTAMNDYIERSSVTALWPRMVNLICLFLGNWNSYSVLKYCYWYHMFYVWMFQLWTQVRCRLTTTEVNPFLISQYVSCPVYHIYLDFDIPALYWEACLEIMKFIAMKFLSTFLSVPPLMSKYPQYLCSSFNVRHQETYGHVVGTYICRGHKHERGKRKMEQKGESFVLK
jgi:hypothetical protein